MNAMKSLLLVFAGLLIGHVGFAQVSKAKSDTLPKKEFWDAMDEGDSLFAAKEYKAAARVYSDADPGGLANGSRHKRYKAARAWMMVGNVDSAFVGNMFTIEYLFHDEITADPAFSSLHSDPRWQKYLDAIK